MPPSDIAPLIPTSSHNITSYRTSQGAAERSPATSSRGSFTGTSRTGASSPTSTPGSRGILEHQPKFFGSSAARTVSKDRARAERTGSRMLVDEDDSRSRLARPGRPHDARDPHHMFHQTRRREEPRTLPAHGGATGSRDGPPHTPSPLIIRDVRTPTTGPVQSRNGSSMGSERSGAHAVKRSAASTPDVARPAKRSRTTRRNTPPIYIASSEDESGPSMAATVSGPTAQGTQDDNDDDDDIQYIPPEQAKNLKPSRKSRSPSRLPLQSIGAAQTPDPRPATIMSQTTTPSNSPINPTITAAPAAPNSPLASMPTANVVCEVANTGNGLGKGPSLAVNALAQTSRDPKRTSATVEARPTAAVSISGDAERYRRLYMAFPYNMSAFYATARNGTSHHSLSRHATGTGPTAAPVPAPSVPATRPVPSTSHPGSTPSQRVNQVDQPGQPSASSPVTRPEATTLRQASAPVALQASRASPSTSSPSVRPPPAPDANLSPTSPTASTRPLNTAVSGYHTRPPLAMGARASWMSSSTTARQSPTIHPPSAPRVSPITSSQARRDAPSTMSASTEINSAPSTFRPAPRSPNQSSRSSTYADTLANMASSFGLDADFLPFTRERSFREFLPSTESLSAMPASPKRLVSLIRPLPADSVQADRLPGRPTGFTTSASFTSSAHSLPQRRPPLPLTSTNSTSTSSPMSNGPFTEVTQPDTTPVAAALTSQAKREISRASTQQTTAQTENVPAEGNMATTSPQGLRPAPPPDGVGPSRTIPSRDRSSLAEAAAFYCQVPPPTSAVPNLASRPAALVTVAQAIAGDVRGASAAPLPRSVSQGEDKLAEATAAGRPATPLPAMSTASSAAPSSSSPRVPRIVLKVSVPTEKLSAPGSSPQVAQTTTPPGSPPRLPRTASHEPVAVSRNSAKVKHPSRRPDIVQKSLADPRSANAVTATRPILPRPIVVTGTAAKGSQSAVSSSITKSSPTTTAILRRSTRSREATPNPDLGESMTTSNVPARPDARMFTSLTLTLNSSSTASQSSKGAGCSAKASADSTTHGVDAISSAATDPAVGQAASNSSSPTHRQPSATSDSRLTVERTAAAADSTSRFIANSPAVRSIASVPLVATTAAVDAGKVVEPPTTTLAPLTEISSAAKSSGMPDGVDRVVKDTHRPAISSPLSKYFSTSPLATRPGDQNMELPTPNAVPLPEEWLFPEGVKLPQITGFVAAVADISGFLGEFATKTAKNAHWQVKSVSQSALSPMLDGRGGSQKALLGPEAYLKDLKGKSALKLPPLFQPKSQKRPMSFLYRNIREGLHGIAALHGASGLGDRRQDKFRNKVIAYRRAEAARRDIKPAPRLDGVLERRELEESLASHCRIHRKLSVVLKSVRFITGNEDVPFDERTVFAIHSQSDHADGPIVEAVRSATLTIRVDGRLVWRDARFLAMGQRKFCKFVGHSANEPIEIILPPNSRSITYELSDMRDRFGDFWPPLEGGPRTWVGRVALGKPRGGRDMLWGEDDLPERIDLRVSPRENSGQPLSDYGVRLSARYEPLALEPSLRMRAIRPSIVHPRPSSVEVTYLTATTPDEVAQAREIGRGITDAASILAGSSTVRGWKCVACRKLGDLGGEEELAIHLKVYHADECVVECFGRRAIGDSFKLGLLIMIGAAMPRPNVSIDAPLVIQPLANRWQRDMIAASSVYPDAASDNLGLKASEPTPGEFVEGSRAGDDVTASARPREDGARALDVSESRLEEDERILDEDTSDASGEVPLEADLSTDALSPSPHIDIDAGKHTRSQETREVADEHPHAAPLDALPVIDALSRVTRDGSEVAIPGQKREVCTNVADLPSSGTGTDSPRPDPPVFALPMTPLTAGVVKAFNYATRSSGQKSAPTDVGAKASAVVLTPPSMVRDLSSELSSIAQSVDKRRPGKLRPWEEDAIVLPGEEVPNYENPLGLMQPQMKGRQNEFTTWSSRINAGTAFDLIPELDKLWDGGEFRYLLRHIEECNISLWHHLSEKRRFMCMCWGRWRDEKGPLTAKKEAMVGYLRQWLDKYAPIMRRAELHDEVIDFFYFLFAEDLVTGRAMRKAVDHWLKLAKQERKRLGQESEQDLWEAEMSKRDGVLAWDEQPDSEAEGPLLDGDQWAIDVIEKYARKFKVTARRIRKAQKAAMRGETSDGDEGRSARPTRVTRIKRKRMRDISEDRLGLDDVGEGEDEVDEEEEERPRTRRRLGLRERRVSRRNRDKLLDGENDNVELTTSVTSGMMDAAGAVGGVPGMTRTTTTTTTTITTTTEIDAAE